jgi:phage-related protein
MALFVLFLTLPIYFKRFSVYRLCISYLFWYNQSVLTSEKPLIWVGSSKKDLMALPVGVRKFFGHALHFAQNGEQHDSCKVLKGFGSAGVLEVVEDDVGGTYRAVYTIKFKEAVFVLHCFQKKSKRGIETPRKDMEIVHSRLKAAEAMAKEILDGKAHS